MLNLTSIQAQTKNKLSSVNISIIVSVALFSYIYKCYVKCSKPDKKLQHIPCINYFQMMKVLMKREPLSMYSRRLVEPILGLSEGLYSRPARLGWTVYVTNPKLMKFILSKQDQFPKADVFVKDGEGTLLNKFIVGPNMVFVHDLDWKRQRRISNHAFQKSIPINTFGRVTIKMFEVIKREYNGCIDIGELFKRLTLDALTISGFGFDINALGDPNNDWMIAYKSIINGMQDPLFFFFPVLEKKYLSFFPKRQKIHNDCDRFLGLINDMIEEKRQIIKNKTSTLNHVSTDSVEKDLLTLMLESEYNTDNKDDFRMTNEELKSNLCLFFSAGHDSTTGSLAFVIYYLSVNQEIQDKARSEVLGILGDTNTDVIPTSSDLKQMVYLDSIVKETMRLHPTVPVASARRAKEDCKIGNTFIPRDTIVLIDIHNTHRSPYNWKNPHNFDPDRFNNAQKDKDNDFENPWLPFGSGARQCVGMNFSLTEQKVVLSMMLRKYEWHLPEGSPHAKEVITKGIFFITPKELNVVILPRY